MKNFNKFLLILSIILILIGFVWAIVVSVQIWDLKLTTMERYKYGIYPAIVACSGVIILHYLNWRNWK
jgi:hypothetical protein